MKKFTLISFKICTILFGFLFLAACDSDDTLTLNQPPSKPENLKSFAIYAGVNRVKVTAIVPAGSSIKEIHLKWSPNDGGITIPIDAKTENFQFERFIEDLKEQDYYFTLQTTDASGSKSAVLDGGVRVYGENYKNQIYNRTLVSKILTNDQLVINYKKLNGDLGALGTEITYKTTSGSTEKLFIDDKQTSVKLPSYQIGTDVYYKSLYKPSLSAIDTLYTLANSFQPIPFPVLKNAAVPFEASATSGRWGNLSMWTSNEAVKNHGGYGGWDSKYGNIFNVESGWGSSAVINGKIYQMVMADAGSYVLQVKVLYTNYSAEDEGGSYFVITKSSSLPDVENLATDPNVVAYQRIDKANLNYSIPFTLMDESEVTIGFLTTQSDSGRYGQISSFEILPGN